MAMVIDEKESERVGITVVRDSSKEVSKPKKSWEKKSKEEKKNEEESFLRDEE